MPNPATAHLFPAGAALDLKALHDDPYETWRRLLAAEPITWVAALGMWYVVKYDHVVEIMNDSKRFITDSEKSPVKDTFGPQMLSVEGDLHDRYKKIARPPFSPKSVRETLERAISDHVGSLIDSFAGVGKIDLRPAFAARIPVLTMLTVFGLPLEDEKDLRRWYDSFEAALANFTRDETIRSEARRHVSAFHEHLDRVLDRAAASGRSLLHQMAAPVDGPALTRDEVKRNASIIFFGGISTVEALVLNTVWALLTHRQALSRVKADPSLVPHAIEESLRWHSPVQSATRETTCEVDFHGVRFAKGDQVNCMLGAANRDPAAFANPDVFDIDRANAKKHVAFAYGPHHCLGSHLAKSVGRLSLEALLSRLANLRLDPDFREQPEGYEFHQPRSLHLNWDPS